MWRADTRSAGGDGCGWESDDTTSGWCSHTSSNRSEWRWGDCWSGAESSSEWGLRKRVEKLEKQMKQVLEGRLMTSTGADDARGSHWVAHDDDQSILETMFAVPRWYGSRDAVPAEQIERAQECLESGFHLVTPYFADHGKFEDTMPFTCWWAHLRSSGLEEFADRTTDGEPFTWQRDYGAKYNYAYDAGETHNCIRVVCQHCRAMIELRWPKLQKLHRRHNEAMMEFLLLRPDHRSTGWLDAPRDV